MRRWKATLSLFLDEATAVREVPTLRMLARSLGEITEQAERIAQTLSARTDLAEFTVVEGFSQMGSGSLPTQNLPTRLVAVGPKNGSADALARRLRRHRVPIFTRVKDDRVWLDPRTLLEGEEPTLVAGVIDELQAGE